MDRPAFDVSPERLRTYADMFEITVSEGDLRQLGVALAAGFAALAALRDLDIQGIEPFVAFPVDRAQS